MRKLILLPILLLSLASCCKKQCWHCTVEQHTEPNGPLADWTHTEMVCDKTYWEIRTYERDNTFTATSGIVTVTQTTTCK